jgi:hypothetical protein
MISYLLKYSSKMESAISAIMVTKVVKNLTSLSSATFPDQACLLEDVYCIIEYMIVLMKDNLIVLVSGVSINYIRSAVSILCS